VRFAEASASPDPSELSTDVYWTIRTEENAMATRKRAFVQAINEALHQQ